MRKILVTGGTVFVSRYIAEYYATKGDEVYVLNRNTKAQSKNTKLIEADRHKLGDCLRCHNFDMVFDVNSYTGNDVNELLEALGGFKDYILISSSAVYPETLPQPFSEDMKLGENSIWGTYGTNKIEAEEALFKRVPGAYVLRPPYLYGAMNNVYREAFVFDCALADREFCLPRSGEMKLQFFDIEDLCRFMDRILTERPKQHVFNVGNKEAVSVKEWVRLCYEAAGKTAKYREIHSEIDQRKYFSFYDYEYYLDVTKQYSLMPETKPMEQGLKEAFDWYINNMDSVNKKPFFDFIDKELKD